MPELIETAPQPGVGEPGLGEPEDALTGKLVAASLAAARLVRPDESALLRSLLDFVACAAAGSRAVATQWPQTPEARLAVAAHALDRDDVHWPSLTHPGAIVWPVVLTTADEVGATSLAVAEAAALGYEVIVRLGLALGPGHRRYWQTTATAGIAGAAAASASLLGGDLSDVETAVSHALSVAGGSACALRERSATGLFHRAHVVTSGLAAARAATAGLNATSAGLEGEAGVLRALCADGDLRTLTEPDVRALAHTSPRLRAVSGWALAAVEAAEAIGPVQADQILTVRVDVSPAAAAMAGDSAPRSASDAWWSIPYAVAATLAAGSTRALEGTSVIAPGTLELAARVTLTGSREDLAAAVTVERVDGSKSRTEAWPRGHERNPASRDDLFAKWTALRGGGGEETYEQLDDAASAGDRSLVAIALRLIGAVSNGGT